MSGIATHATMNIVSKPALVIIVFAIMCCSLLLQSQQHSQIQRVLAARTERDAEIQRLIVLKSYWQSVVADSPTFRDGYVQLAYVDWKLGNAYHAQLWMKKALEVDPNFQPPITLTFLLAPLSQK